MKKTAALIVLIPLLTGMRACSWFPSTFFTGLDQDGNERLSYREWMAYYGLPMHDHPIEDCMRADFYLADCNQDDYLTWDEYYAFRFKQKSCESPAVMTLRQKYEANEQLQVNPTRQAFERLMVEQARELMTREEELKRRYHIAGK